MMGSGASHLYSAVGDQNICVDVLILAKVNLSSRAHYIGVGGGSHYPLIEGIAPNQGMGSGLGPLWPSPLEINSNILHLDLHGPILNSKLKTKIRLNIYFLTD
jgi:hypothetical protein